MYKDLTFKFESDETDCLSIVNIATSTCKTKKYQHQLYKYADIVKSKVAKAKTERVTRLRRKEVATDIRGYRKTILNLLSAIQTSEREKDVLILQDRIQNI